jgi:hypothetical protein
MICLITEQLNLFSKVVASSAFHYGDRLYEPAWGQRGISLFFPLSALFFPHGSSRMLLHSESLLSLNSILAAIWDCVISSSCNT